MNERFHMASTAFRGEQETPQSLVAVEEAEYLRFEFSLSNEEGESTLQEGIRRSSMSLKLLVIKVLKNQRNQPKLFEEVIEYLKNECDKIAKESGGLGKRDTIYRNSSTGIWTWKKETKML